MSKALISVSRVDLDSRIMNRDAFLVKTASKEFEHTRTYSAISKRKDISKTESSTKKINHRTKNLVEKPDNRFEKFRSVPETGF